jgi:hypothetical protein
LSIDNFFAGLRPEAPMPVIDTAPAPRPGETPRLAREVDPIGQ